MEKLDIHSIETKLRSDLEIGSISGRVILDRLRLIDEDSRKTAPYLDHKYAPFYYYLGKYISPKSMIEMGFDLGLLSCSFLTSCKKVERFFGYREESPNFVPLRIGKSNIKLRFKGHADFYLGKMHDFHFQKVISDSKWDLVLVNDETAYDKHLDYLEIIWDHVSEFGCIVCEYLDRHEPAKEAFDAFSHSKNRKPIFFKTRYGTGIIQK